MPRRNDIAGRKPLIIGALLAVLGLLLVSSAALACSIFPPIVNVAADFDVLVVDDGRPIAGIPIQVFKVGPKSNQPLLTLTSDDNGRVAIRGLAAGDYSVESKGAIWVPGFVARVGDPKAKKLKKLVEFNWPFNQIVQAKSLRGKLWSANPHLPFEDLEVKLLRVDGAAVSSANQFSGRTGQFDFSEVKPGLYVLWMHARQPTAPKGFEAEGSIVVQVAPDAQSAPESLDLSIAMSSCGIEYAQCAPAAPVRLASREIDVTDPMGAVIGSAEYVAESVSDHRVVSGRTNSSGIAQFSDELGGAYKFRIFSLGFTPLDQIVEFAPPEPGASPLHVTLDIGGNCSKASLEKHATQR